MATIPLPDNNSLLNLSNQIGQTDIAKSASSLSDTTPNYNAPTVNIGQSSYTPTAKNLVNSESVSIPEKTYNTNYSAKSAGQTSLVNNLEKVNNTTNNINNTTTSTSYGKTPEELYAESISKIGAPESLADLRANLELQQGVAEKKKVASDLAAKINAIDAEAEVAKRTLESSSSGRDVTSTFLGRQQQEIDRQLSIKKAPLTAQYQVAIGDLQGAQETVNQLVSDTVSDRKAQREYELGQIELAYTNASAAEKRILEAKAEEVRVAEREADKLDAFKNSAIGVMKDANDYSKLSEIMAATSKEEVARLAEGITLQSTKNVGALPVGGNYADIVNTILGSGTFTDSQATRIVNAINAGQNPLPIIQNQAKNIMGQTLATSLTNTEKAKSAVQQIDTLLKQYYENGGKSDIFTGTFENVAAKVGTVTNQKLRGLATQIETALQIYRNAVSGTAYSVQEGKAIAAIFPGINKTQGLNESIINSRLAVFDDQIDSTYRAILGTPYDDLKNTLSQQSTGNTGSSNIVTAPDGTLVEIID